MCVAYDYDPPKIHSVTIRKARKQHVCCECGSIIEHDSNYAVTRGMWDDKWTTYKACLVCHVVSNWFMANQQNNYMLGKLWTAVTDATGLDKNTFIGAPAFVNFICRKLLKCSA